MNKKIILRYILLNIYLDQWKPGDKISTIRELSIKFHVNLNTIKKILNKLVTEKILISQERIGYFINSNIYSILPFSLRQQYNVFEHSFEVYNNKNITTLIKKYSFNKTDVDIWCESQIDNDIFFKFKYNIKKSFMYNLAFSGFIVFRIYSNFIIEKINNNTYVLEKRYLYDEDNNLLVKEKIYIPINIWKNIKIFSLL